MFRGSYVVIVTPFRKDGSLDEEALRNNVDWYIERGAPGIVCTGTTGEFDALSDEEIKHVIKVTVDQVNGKVPVIAGTAATSTWKTKELSKFAEDAGADGVMIVPPYYYLPSEEEIIEHYREVAEAIDIPIMVYNNPWTSKVDMKPQLIAKLAELNNVRYVKESSGDIRRIEQILRLAEPKITVFCGSDVLAFESFVLGAQGWVSATANIIPRETQQLFRLIADEKKIDEARKLFFWMLPLLEFVEDSGKISQVVKAALNIIGEKEGIPKGGYPRKPRLPIGKDEEAKLRKILKQMGLTSTQEA